MSLAAERLEHAALAPTAGHPVAAAACTDRVKLAVLLQAAGLLSLADAAGASLVHGWSGAAVDEAGRLCGLAVRFEPAAASAQERLRDLLLTLFRGGERIAGRGVARAAARELLSAWEGGLAPMSADEAVGRIFDAAPFLAAPEFTFAHAALRGVWHAEGRANDWLAGPARIHERLRGPRGESEEGGLERAEALLAAGRFEAALDALPGGDENAEIALAATCRFLLGELGAARELVERLASRALTVGERLDFGDTALRVLALSGQHDGAADWAARALAEARLPQERALAHLLAAAAALDRGAREVAERHLGAVEIATAGPRVIRAWHEVQVWLAQDDGQGAAEVLHARAVLAGRRHLRLHEAGRAWTNLGLGYLTIGDFALAERAFQHSARLLRRCDGPLAITLAQWNLAEARLRLGKLFEVERILRASAAHNRRSGNRRGLAVDEALWLRLELVRGRPEATVERATQWLAESRRSGEEFHQAQLAVLAARACGWLERPGEAADWLALVGPAGLSELEAEELSGLFALAGRVDEARARAAATPFAALWLPVLAGEVPPHAAFAPIGTESSATLPPAAFALRELAPYRRARLLLDLELTLPGAVPRAAREAAAELFRRGGAHRYAAILTRGEAGQWAALREYLERPRGDRRALADLFVAIGAPDAELVWTGPAGEVRWLDPQVARPFTEELLGECGGGTLRLSAARVDEVVRAVFALCMRELPDLQPAPGGTRERAAAGGSALVGSSPALVQALERLRQFAAGEMPVLLLGESGTGKELAAMELRRASPRAAAPWVPVNCAALSETLLLSDLFGHARGAFTGADRARAGVFETAHGGTVFLDEIGDLPAVAQGNLLRVLQEGEVRRLGESTARRVDVRIVAATHRDLQAMVREGKFRQDLYYRLRVSTVVLPPLRERGGDLMLLAERFVERERVRRELPELQLAADARRALEGHRWPGNVRELQNVLQAAAALAGNGPIRAAMLDLGAPAASDPEPEPSAYHRDVDVFRRNLVRTALRAAGGNRAEAARRLGLSRQALSYLAKQLGLSDDERPGETAHRDPDA